MTRRTPDEYDFPRLEFDQTILTKHRTVLKGRDIKGVCWHHMTIPGKDNSDSALDACFRVWQTRQASAHYGVQGEQIRQYVWDKDYAWATGSNIGNLYFTSIEHTNSTAGPKWLVSNQTIITGAKLTAYIHIAEGLGRPTSNSNGTSGTIRQHESFTATACPGPYLGGTQWNAAVREAQRQYDLAVKGTATTPKPVPPKPTDDRPVDWFTHTGWNLGGLDTVGDGAETFEARIDDICAEMVKIGADVFSFVEIRTEHLAKFKRALAKIGFKVAVYGKARAVVVRDTMRVGRTFIYKYPENGPADDDRYMAVAEVFPTTGPNAAMITAGHLEHRTGDAYDKVRVTQAKQGIAKATRVAENWGIHPTRIVMFDDENSDTWVLEQAYEDAGFHDSFDGAWQADNEGTATLNGWTTSTRAGTRIDKTKLYGRRRARRAHVRKDSAGIADHLPVTTVLAQI